MLGNIAPLPQNLSLMEGLARNVIKASGIVQLQTLPDSPQHTSSSQLLLETWVIEPKIN